MLVKGGDDDSGMMSEMNVTPLVDVMLVLLVVFIVTAPLLTPQSLGVKLPKTEAVQSPIDREQMRLLILPDNKLSLDGKVMSDQQVKVILGDQSHDSRLQIHIEADEDMRYGRLAEVMALAQSAGVTRLGFVTVGKNR